MRVGAHRVDITPRRAIALYGYPGVPRVATGILDPLQCAALWIEGDTSSDGVLLISCDVVFVSRDLTQRVRNRIAQRVEIEPERILIAATHTHSGPSTVEALSDAFDPHVPPPDPQWLAEFEDAIVACAVAAHAARRPARFDYVVQRIEGIGGNRHDPAGPSDADVPVLAFRSDDDRHELIAIATVVSVHPTVLHEDSPLYSGDFPGLARQHLPAGVPVLHFCGASGDQSPRHFIRGNTVDEARTLARRLADGLNEAISRMRFARETPTISLASESVELPLRALPAEAMAADQEHLAARSLQRLKEEGADRAAIRTAECDLFGAQATLSLARLAASGRLDAARQSCVPAILSVLRIGELILVHWPGEWFVEFGLAVRAMDPAAHVVTMSCGELQGYVVTQQAIDNNWYEAGQAVFDSTGTSRIVLDATKRLLAEVRSA
jgi:hypothetical protein